MKKIIAINYSLISREGIAKAQNALEFDGVDDYAEIHSTYF